MLYVLEGCDGVGKTTIAKNFAALNGARVIHCTKNTENDYRFFLDIIRAAERLNIVADRFMYGQFVYQEERDRKLNQASLNLLEMELIKTGGQVFYVTAQHGEVKKRLSIRDEKIINGLTSEEVDRRFRAVFEKISLLRVKELQVDPETGLYTICDMRKV